MRKALIGLTLAGSLGAGVTAGHLYSEYGDKEYIVMVKPGASGGDDLENIAASVGEVKKPIDGLSGYIVETDRNTVRSFSVPSEEYIVEPLIEYKLPDILRSAEMPWGCGFDPVPPLPEPPPTDDPQIVDWGVDRVRVLDKLRDGASVTVCVADTGIDKTHPDLRHEVGRNFTSSDPSDYQDRQKHGSHVAGIIAAVDNAYGVVGSSQSKIIVAKVLNDYGSGNNAGIAAGITWCVDNGADIINLSLGGPSPSSALQASLEYAFSRGAIAMVAAGNDSSSFVGYPAGYQYPGRLYSVAATNGSDSLAYFSNYGKIEMSCPGVGILSTVPGGYERLSGTSMATPLCAGVMARYIGAGLSPVYDDIGEAFYFGSGLIVGDGL